LFSFSPYFLFEELLEDETVVAEGLIVAARSEFAPQRLYPRTASIVEIRTIRRQQTLEFICTLGVDVLYK
jgi:hypothetical protein